MKISLSIPDEFMITNHGYGVISQQIVASLQRLGHSVPYRDPSAQVELCIGQPYLWSWSSKSSYKIGLSAWESTKIPKNWKPMLSTCDELWTPSPVIAKHFADEGYPADVYEHGVDAEVWKPKLRKVENRPLRFLHIGEPAPRKGGQLAYDTFKELFGNSDRARLTIKAHGGSTIRGRRNLLPDRELKNVQVITDEFPEELMVDMVRRHDVLLYPSYGEGFGLIPLQAMATGMPVICTDGWPPYGDLLLPSLRVKSVLDKTPWDFHTGDMWHPDKTDLADAMSHAVDDFNALAQHAYSLVPYVTRRYNWDRLTKKAFAHILENFDS